MTTKTETKTEIQKVDNSPAEMIRMAVTGGADLEKLEKLLNLQERWEANEAKKAFQQAISQFKANPPVIEKDRTVAFGNTRYNHASLFNVVQKITHELSKYGLSASWVTSQNGTVGVTCRISHVLGHSEETTISAPADTSGAKNAIQAIGSTISYLQRYSLLSILGLATADQDDDGQASSARYVTEEQLATLKEHMIAVKADEKRVLAFLKIDSLDKMTVPQYQKLLVALKENEAKK